MATDVAWIFSTGGGGGVGGGQSEGAKRPSGERVSPSHGKKIIFRNFRESKWHFCTLKPQDSLGEFDNFFSCSSESAGNH